MQRECLSTKSLAEPWRLRLGFLLAMYTVLYIFALVFCYQVASSQTLTLHGPPPGGKKLKHDAKVEVAKTRIKAASKVNLCRLRC